MRAFDFSSERLDATDVYVAGSEEEISDVAYSAESDSLFVASKHKAKPIAIVRSFARINNSEWSERNQTQFERKGSRWIHVKILRDGTLIYGQSGTAFIHVCRVHADRSIQNCKSFATPTKHNGFDTQLVDKDKRLAVAFENGSVAIFRMSEERIAYLPPLITLVGARHPLYLWDSLLVGKKTKAGFYAQEAILFSTSGSRQLITLNDKLDIETWCSVHNHLFVSNFKSRELLIYEIYYI